MKSNKSNNSNTLTESEFLLEHILWIVVTWVWFKNILFRCIGNYSLTESKIIFFLVLGIACILGIFCNIRKARNDLSVFFNIVTGYGFYTVLTYLKIRRNLIITVLSITVVISIVIGGYIMRSQIKRRNCSRKTIRATMFTIAGATQRIMGLGFLVILIVAGGSFLFGSSIIQSSVKPSVTSDSYDQLLYESKETIVLLDEDIWTSLTVQKKTGALQIIANLERSNLGVSNELNLCVANLEEEDLLGRYDDSTHEIVIDMDLLINGSVQDVLRCLLHEVRHSFQHRLVDLYNEIDTSDKNLQIFREVSLYAEEFENYNDKDYSAYYDQQCEIDARDYAEERMEFYDGFIRDSKNAYKIGD